MTLDQFIQTFGETPQERWHRTIRETVTPAEMVQQGHAFVESELDIAIQSELRRPASLEAMRLSFAQKVGLASAMAGKDFDEELIWHLNKLDEANQTGAISDFISLCLSKGVSTPSIGIAERAALQFICVALCCSIQEISRRVSQVPAEAECL